MRCLERWYSRNTVALSGAHVEVVFGFTSQNYGSVGTLLSTKNAGVKGNQITQPILRSIIERRAMSDGIEAIADLFSIS